MGERKSRSRVGWFPCFGAPRSDKKRQRTAALQDAGALFRTPLIKHVAQESGGRVFFPSNDNEITEAAAQIAHDLRRQYSIEYQSTNVNTKDNYRRVEAKIVEGAGRPKLTAIMRPGYFLVRPEVKSKEKKPKG